MENKTNNARYLIDGVSVFCAFDEVVDIKGLKENPRNPNTHPTNQIELLAQIIKKTGWRAPITVSNLSGFIVKGHGRLQAAKAAGLKQVPIEYQNFKDEEEEMAALLADNKLAELAEIDVEKLTDIFKDYEFKDLDLTGYSKDEYDELVGAFKEAELLGDPDDVPEEVETRCKLGDIWHLGNHRLMCGDSTSVTDVEKLMNSDKADMVFTDPPYGVEAMGARGQTFKSRKMKFIENDDLKEQNLVAFLSSFISIMQYKQGASIYICYPWATQEEFTLAIKENNLCIKNCIIWDKKVFGLNGSFKGYRPQYEMIYFCCKDDFAWYGDKAQSNIWQIAREIKRDEQGNHPTPKPIELIAKALNNSSKKEDVIYDAFGGSGSTLIACEQLNRKCYMMELDPHYCDVIITRWETLTGKKAELLS